jgi:hypothetical protein
VRPQLDLARRRSTFDEVVGGLDDSIGPDAAAGLHLYRVRWIEGRETIFRPGADVRILGGRAA